MKFSLSYLNTHLAYTESLLSPNFFDSPSMYTKNSVERHSMCTTGCISFSTDYKVKIFQKTTVIKFHFLVVLHWR